MSKFVLPTFITKNFKNIKNHTLRYSLNVKTPKNIIKALIGLTTLCFAWYFFLTFFALDSILKQSSVTKDPFEAQYSKMLLDRNGALLSVFLNKKEQWHLKATIPVPDKLKIAVLEYEDKRFYSHFGIDILAIIRTIKNNLIKNNRAGASTITMQVSKFLNAKNERSYKNKIDEMIYALRLESLYSKDEILTMYLNNASYGRNIIGFSGALLLYFGLQNPNEITWAQAALLAVLPNAPGLINLEKNKDVLLQKRNALLTNLHQKGHFNDDILKLASKEPLPKKLLPHKNLAPHLALRLIKEQKGLTPIIHSSIDKNIQARFEQRVQSYLQILQKDGIANASVLLVDTKSREVITYIGSQDFLDIANYGQIDGIVAKRSPGSLLKPLLYALSIDEGLISPYSKLVDTPLFFGAFAPQNANKKYYGLITAQTALAKSLNVPFVKLLQEYGYEKFFFTLKDILHFKDNDYTRYGLSLILGTKELSVEDIAKIFAGLGNYGVFANLRYDTKEPCQENFNTTHSIQTQQCYESKTKRFISAGASYLTLRAMQRLDRAGLENLHKDKKIFSWKSGTSYGRKDAWAAGTSPKYTLVVWVGNFTGEPNPKIFGVKTAGSLLFELLGELDGLDSNFTQQDIQTIALDSPTGYRLSEEFKNLGIAAITAPYPQNALPLRTSPFLKSLWIDEDSKKELNSLDEGFENAKQVVRLELPTAVLNYYSLQNIDINSHLLHTYKNNKVLKILYPSNGLKIIQPIDFDGHQNFIIRFTNLKKQKFFAYLDSAEVEINDFNSTSVSLQTELDTGEHSLYIIGEDGSEDWVSFEIVR